MLSAGQCYNRLIRYQNALQRFEEIGAEMQQDYQSDNSVRIKRLAKEPGALPEAKKSIKFGDTASIETHQKPVGTKRRPKTEDPKTKTPSKSS